MTAVDLEKLLELEPPSRRPRGRLPKLELRQRLQRTLARLAPPAIPRPSDELVEDALLISGLAAIAAGCGWIFPPTAPIVGGVFLVVLALRAARASAGAGADPQLRDEAIVKRVYGPGDEDDD